jgi:hypothetical protein
MKFGNEFWLIFFREYISTNYLQCSASPKYGQLRQLSTVPLKHRELSNFRPVLFSILFTSVRSPLSTLACAYAVNTMMSCTLADFSLFTISAPTLLFRRTEDEDNMAKFTLVDFTLFAQRG